VTGQQELRYLQVRQSDGRDERRYRDHQQRPDDDGEPVTHMVGQLAELTGRKSDHQSDWEAIGERDRMGLEPAEMIGKFLPSH
jgi:hypothetical protein